MYARALHTLKKIVCIYKYFPRVWAICHLGPTVRHCGGFGCQVRTAAFYGQCSLLNARTGGDQDKRPLFCRAGILDSAALRLACTVWQGQASRPLKLKLTRAVPCPLAVMSAQTLRTPQGVCGGQRAHLKNSEAVVWGKSDSLLPIVSLVSYSLRSQIEMRRDDWQRGRYLFFI